MMRAAHIRPLTPAFPLALRRAELWRRDLENMRSGWGVRCITSHVSDADWQLHWHRGNDPFTALIDELRFTD